MEVEWIPLGEIEPGVEKRNLHGVKVDVLVSPYDIPEAVRGYYQHDRHCFVIEFKYISNEDTVEKTRDDNVTLRVGRNSGRLYGILLDVNAIQGGAIRVRVKVAEALRNVLTHLVQQPLSEVRSSNYKIAKDVVEKNEDRILQPV